MHDEYLATAEDAPDPSVPTEAEAIRKTTQESTVPVKPEEATASIFTKSATETRSTFSHDFGKLTQSCTTAAVENKNNSNQAQCSGNSTDTKQPVENSRVFVFPAVVPGFEVVSLAKDNMQTSTISIGMEEKPAEQPSVSAPPQGNTSQTSTSFANHATHVLNPIMGTDPYFTNADVWTSYTNTLGVPVPPLAFDSRLGAWSNYGKL